VITDKALFDFENAEREMQLISLYPGTTLDDVAAEMGWKVRVAEALTETPAPTADELSNMRRLRASGTTSTKGASEP
jgi:glutaconate CoA-transferase subunit B